MWRTQIPTPILPDSSGRLKLELSPLHYKNFVTTEERLLRFSFLSGKQATLLEWRFLCQGTIATVCVELLRKV